jgi:hypothetical protein
VIAYRESKTMREESREPLSLSLLTVGEGGGEDPNKTTAETLWASSQISPLCLFPTTLTGRLNKRIVTDTWNRSEPV